MKLRTSLFIAMGVLGYVGQAWADDTKDFITNATVAGEFEIESSKLALEKSQNKDIKQFAQEMIDDHTKASDQMKAVLQKDSIDPAKEELDSKHQALMDKLQGLSGDDFNNQYVSIQKKAHKEAVSLFTDYSKNGDNSDLKDFAAKTLPTLQEHLDHVKALKKKLASS